MRMNFSDFFYNFEIRKVVTKKYLKYVNFKKSMNPFWLMKTKIFLFIYWLFCGNSFSIFGIIIMQNQCSWNIDYGWFLLDFCCCIAKYWNFNRLVSFGWKCTCNVKRVFLKKWFLSTLDMPTRNCFQRFRMIFFFF